jgi:hypothetical protein
VNKLRMIRLVLQWIFFFLRGGTLSYISGWRTLAGLVKAILLKNFFNFLKAIPKERN